MEFQSMTIEERLELFKEFTKDGEKTNSILGDSSLGKYVSNLTGYEISVATKLLSQANSIFELTDPDAVIRVLRFFRSQKEFYADNTTLTAHYRDDASYILKYLEFVCYYRGVEMPNVEDAIKTDDFSINAIVSAIRSTGLIYEDSLVKRFAFSLLTKPFVILSGLAGSGKTQLALAFAHALSETPNEQICTVAVGADWTNREPLLGYANALEKDNYVLPESGALQLLIKAIENPNDPYFLILDEMNMSYVERYFADFLSAMESKKPIRLWETKDKDVPVEIVLPDNLFIIGTINVDETTYMFSPKVLDRANVIEFKVSYEEMERFLNVSANVNIQSLKAESDAVGKAFVTLAQKIFEKQDDTMKITLLNFFKELKSVGAEFGFRSAKEIYRFMGYALTCDDSTSKMNKDDIVDAAIVQKLLPKLHGSLKSLKPVLETLWTYCFEGDAPELSTIGTVLPTGEETASYRVLYKNSADKIFRMYRSAIVNGFTSFSEA